MTSQYMIYRLPGGELVESYGGELCDNSHLTIGNCSIFPWFNVKFGEERPLKPAVKSTHPTDYKKNVSSLINKLGREGGKTVVARQICGEFTHFEPRKMAEEYFSMFPDMFCFLFYSPAVGYWMGATPELLVDVKDENHYETRALAGTRPFGTDQPWSKKNIEEHQIVVDDICRRANALEGLKIEVGERYNFRYGEIEHLCTPIFIENAANIDDWKMTELWDNLHPTAAVCGYPRDVALRNISKAEGFSRKFYGGLINIPRGEGKLTTYVILRCVHFDNKHWCVYTGSGITSLSSPDDEWLETEQKAASLINLLKKY